MSIRHDYHLHSDFSGDSETPAAAMAERAASLGLEGMCFTEHEDPDAPVTDIDFTVDFERYFSTVQKLRDEYRGRLNICIGMEFGILPQVADMLPSLACRYPFDFIIASCHFVGGKDPYYPAFFEGRSEEDCYRQYFHEQYKSLKLFSDYDTLGHMDYVVRYGPNRNQFYSYETYADCIDPILRHIIENGKCLEVNTGGLKYGLGEPNPSTEILKRYRELGGELISVGSDAHAPQHLCYDFGRAEKILTELGFRYYTVFEHRIPRQIRF